MTNAYETFGVGYALVRKPDARIAEHVARALVGCQSVVNVGAGTGSYEPVGRWVLGIEPSSRMIAQRSSRAAPCIRAVAEQTPIRDQAVDAVTGFLTVHHWSDLERGLAECKRIARKRIILLTQMPRAAPPFWLTQTYFPEVARFDESRFPSLASLEQILGPLKALSVPIPFDCTDGFYGAYWRRPHAYLEPAVRDGISVLRQISPHVRDKGLAALKEDLQSGEWAQRFGKLLSMQELDLGYRLLVHECDSL